MLPQTKYTKLRKGKLAYWDIGSGDSILMLHGFCEQKSMFLPFLELAKTHRLLIPDLPGFGQSDRLEGSGSMEKYAQVIGEFIQQQEGQIDLLVGHSMGAYLGLHMLQKNLQLCRGFSIFHAHPFADNEAIRLKRKKSIEFISKHGIQQWLKPFYTNLFPASKRQEMESRLNVLTEESINLHPEAVIFAQEAMADRADHKVTLQHFPGLVQCIVGDLDEIAPRALGLKQVTLPKRCLYHHLDNCGHMGQWEAPRQIEAYFQEMLSAMQILSVKA